MDPLFDGVPAPLPPPMDTIWVSVHRVGEVPEPPPRVRHAEGYAAFVGLAARFGTDARALFDLWAFAHFVRAHREALEADAALLRSAVVFLGNVLIAAHSECFWVDHSGPAVRSQAGRADGGPGADREPAEDRYLGVGGTVPAILAADEARFLEFGNVVRDWRPGAPARRPGRIPIREEREHSS